MPTIKQLPLATSVSASDLLPLSQGGVTRGLTVGELLSSTQAAISLTTGKLLRRASPTAGGPEPVGLGIGLMIASGTMLATGLDHTVLPVSSGLVSGDEVVVNSAGAAKRMPAVLLRSLFAAGNGVAIDGFGTISASGGGATIPATSSTLGGVKVGAGLTIAQDGTLTPDTAALSAEFATTATVQATVRAAVAVAAPSARQYNAVGDGVTDNLPALQAYINDVIAAGGGECLIPAGRFLVSGTLTATLAGNTALTIRGVGADLTELTFSGDTDGLVVTYSSKADYRRDVATGAKLRVEGLSVVRALSSVGHDGIRIVGDSANSTGAIEPSTVIAEVTFRGTSAGGGWLNHLVYQDTANTSTSQVSIIAANASSIVAASSSGIVIRTTGSHISTLHAVNGLNTWGCNRALDIGERIQGVEVVNSNCTGGNYGIYWNSNGRQEQLSVVNCQFSTLGFGIYVYNLQNVQITNNTFYNQNGYVSSPGSWIAISLVEVDNAQISGNGILGANVGSEIGIEIVNDLALVAVNRPSTISGNTFYNLKGVALSAGNTTTNVLFSGNNSDGISGSPPIAIGGSASVSFAGNQFGEALYLLGYPGAAQPSLVSGGGTMFAVAPTHPSPAAGDSSNASATTAFVQGTVGLSGARVTSGASYAMAVADRVVVVNKTAGSATAVTLPSSPTAWATYLVKDGTGDAGTNPITISGTATIDGAPSFVISTGWACVSLVFTGVQWSIV